MLIVSSTYTGKIESRWWAYCNGCVLFMKSSNDETMYSNQSHICLIEHDVITQLLWKFNDHFIKSRSLIYHNDTSPVKMNTRFFKSFEFKYILKFKKKFSSNLLNFVRNFMVD